MPIGDQDNNFNGVLDGDGYTISDLYIARNENHQGMFGILGVSADVFNITLSGFDITAGDDSGYHVGTLAGISYGDITNITVQESAVMGDGPVGGLLGSMFDGDVSEIFITGVEVLSLGYNIGGAIGYVFTQGESNTIENIYVSDTTVSGDYYVGGAIGLAGPDNGNETNTLIITNSYAQTNVSASAGAGGFIGLLAAGTVQRSYSAGVLTGDLESNTLGGFVGVVVLGGIVQDSFSVVTVTGGDIVGGFVGLVGQRGMLPPGGGYIHRVYSTGSVTGDTNVGGLVGLEENNDGEITYSYWNIDTSGQDTSSAGTGKTTAQMSNIATFETWDILGLDEEFESPYPALSAEEDAGSVWIIAISDEDEEQEEQPQPIRRSSGSRAPESILRELGISPEAHQSTIQSLMAEITRLQNILSQLRNNTPSPQTLVCTPALRIGSTGENVRILQRLLGNIGIDGQYGPQTANAVGVFQKANNLTEDQIAGPKTCSTLLSQTQN